MIGEASNGREALDKALELKPDPVTLDISMPVMNGIEAAKELKRIFPNLPVVLFTNFAETCSGELALETVADAVVPKSQAKELVAMVRLLLGSSSSQWSTDRRSA